MRKIDFDYREHICPVCGRQFIPAPQHVYKLARDNHYQKVCSWHCLCEARRGNHKAPQGRARTVVKINAAGNRAAIYDTIREAAKAQGVQPSTMAQYIRKANIMKDGSHYEFLERKYYNG